MAQAQQPSNPLSADLAVTYTTDRAKIATVDCGCFWMQGGSFDAAVPVFRGLGVAANLTGGHSAGISPGVDLSTLTFAAGPRYTYSTTRWTRRVPRFKRGTSVFGEALFGSARGFDGVFPTSSGVKNSTNALAMQFGGGVNVSLVRGFGVRAIELDYERTSFRNFATNTQNDLRIGVGVTYHVGER
jgi:hypothetical protein